MLTFPIDCTPPVESNFKPMTMQTLPFQKCIDNHGVLVLSTELQALQPANNFKVKKTFSKPEIPKPNYSSRTYRITNKKSTKMLNKNVTSPKFAGIASTPGTQRERETSNDFKADKRNSSLISEPQQRRDNKLDMRTEERYANAEDMDEGKRPHETMSSFTTRGTPIKRNALAHMNK